MVERIAIVVIGMHRSGSSAMARLLSLVGAALPKRLMTATEWNETGHWEPQHVALYNDRVLAAVDATWDSPFGLGMNAHRRAVFDPFVEEARSILVEEYGDAPLIVLKEPRISLLTDLWIKALEAEQFTCKFVVTVRSPIEVAASLRRRDGFALDKGLLLWSAYLASSELLTRSYDRIFCHYDDVLARPEAVLDDIEAKLGIEFPRRTAKAQAAADAFIRPDMKHNHAAAGGEIPDHLSPINALSDYIEALMGGETPDIDASRNVQKWLADLDRTTTPLILATGETLKAEAASAVAAARAEVAGQKAEVEERSRTLELGLAAATNAQRETQALLQAREDEIAALRTELEAAAARASELSDEKDRLKAADVAAAEVLTALAADLARAESDARSTRIEQRAREEELIAAQALSQRRDEQITALRTELEAAAARVGELSEEKDRLEAADVAAAEVLTALAADLARAESKAENARIEGLARQEDLIAAQALVQRRDDEIAVLRTELEAATRRADEQSDEKDRLEAAASQATAALAALASDLAQAQSKAENARNAWLVREAELIAAAEALIAERDQINAAKAAEAAAHGRAREEHIAALAARDAEHRQQVADQEAVFQQREAELAAGLSTAQASDAAALRDALRQAEEAVVAHQEALDESQREAAVREAALLEEIATLQGVVQAGADKDFTDEALAGSQAQLIAQLSDERAASAAKEQSLVTEVEVLREDVMRAEQAAAALRQSLLQKNGEATLVEADLLERIAILQDGIGKYAGRAGAAVRNR